MSIRRIEKKMALSVAVLMLLGGFMFNTVHAQEEDKLVKILRTTNKAQTNTYVPKVYEFKNANPFGVRAYIQRSMEIEEGFQQTFVAPNGTSGLYLVVCPEYQIPYIDELVARLDRPGQTSLNGWQRVYMPTKHRSVADDGFINALLNYGDGDAGNFFIGDLETNAMRFVGTPSSIENLQAAMEFLDWPTPQAKINVTIYEVDIQDDGAVGLDYMAWKNGPGRSLFALGAFGEVEKVTTSYGSNGFILGDQGRNVYGLPGNRMDAKGANAAYNFNVSSAYFDFLVSKGEARVVKTASIMAMSDTSFAVEATDQIPYTESVVVGSGGNGVRDEFEPFEPDDRILVTKLQEVGVTVAGFVFIGANKRIGLTFSNSASTLAGFSSSGVPIINSQSFETDTTLEAGREYVIGGLIRERTIKTTSKVPILGSLPVLGWIFGGEKNIKQKSILISVVHPERIDDFSGLSGGDQDVIAQASAQ